MAAHRFPWPVQKLVKLDKRKQLIMMQDKETLTSDNINLIVLGSLKKVGKDQEESDSTVFHSTQDTFRHKEQFLLISINSITWNDSNCLLLYFHDVSNSVHKEIVESLSTKRQQSILHVTHDLQGITSLNFSILISEFVDGRIK